MTSEVTLAAGLAGDGESLTVLALWDALQAQTELIRNAQFLQVQYLVGDRTREDHVQDMLGLLDGPEQRAALEKVEKARTTIDDWRKAGGWVSEAKLGGGE